MVLEDAQTDTKSCGRPEKEDRKEVKDATTELLSHFSSILRVVVPAVLSVLSPEPLGSHEWHSSLPQPHSGKTRFYSHCSAVPTMPRLPEERGPG